MVLVLDSFYITSAVRSFYNCADTALRLFALRVTILVLMLRLHIHVDRNTQDNSWPTVSQVILKKAK